MLALFLQILNLYYVTSYMILGGADLQGSPLNINNWQAEQTDGQIITYDPSSDVKCQIQLFPLINSHQFYQKTFYLTSNAFDRAYIEFEAYFIELIPCLITVLVNSQQIYQKQFNNLEITNICGGVDSQYTFFIPFYISTKTLLFKIKYEQINQDNQSYLGIRNLNIYTNGVPQINGCPYDQPFIQTDGTCVTSCNNGCQYLSGPQLGYCTNDATCSSKLLYSYTTSQQIWKLATTPSILEQTYLTQIGTIYYLNNNNNYANIMQSQLFVSPFGAQTSLYYYLQQSFLPTKKLQVSFIFYIFGEWDDGSTIGLSIQGTGIYVNNVVNISKSRNIYISSTGSGFYQRNITNQNGQSETIWQTLITYQSNFYAASVKMGFTQCIYSTSGLSGSYGFSDIQVYQSDSDPNVLLYGLFGLPYSCQSPYFAYLGTCIVNCPTHTRISVVDRNCTDYLFTESKFLNSSLIISGYARYIVKQFHNQNFEESDINILFTIFPLNYMNFQSSKQYSFIGNKKILGGYNSWGSGTYGLQASNFSSHYQLRLYLKLYMIDDWQINDTFSIYVDGVFIQSYKQVKTQQLAGTQSWDQQIDVELVIAHTMKQVQILFVCTLNAFDSRIASCGISDLFVLIDKNSDVQCSGVNSYYSFFTGRCEKCQASKCVFFPTYNPYSNKCAYACVNCQTTSICIACDAQSGFHLVSNSCTCRESFVASNDICFACHYSCLTCTGQKSTNCQSPCPATRVFSSNQCLCNQNYVDVYNLKDCQLIISNCHYSCSTCYGQQYYNCVTCPQNSYRQLIIISSTSVCQCITNYTEQWQNQICKFIQPCHISCLTCQGFLSTDCLTCKLNYILIGNTCICPNGYNILNAQQDCVQNNILCHQTCLTCIDNYYDKCISCDVQRQLVVVNQQLYQFICQCIDGYNDNNNICQQCDLSCLTCMNSGPNNCLTCDSNKLRIQANLNSCECQSGYNDNLNKGNICVVNLTICHYSCNVCFGLVYDQCIVCPISSNRQLNLNQCQCKTGFFDDGQQICLQCYQTCLTCSGILFDQCSTCDIAQYRILNGTECECIQGFNDKLDQLTCVQNYSPCDLNCDTCYGQKSDNCLTCGVDMFLTINNTCDCYKGYVKDQYQCIDCMSDKGMIIYECQYKNSNDGIWTYGEQCDNGSNNIREGCYNNIIQKYYGCTNIIKEQSICYKCPDHCIKCTLIDNIIICQQCDDNYFNQLISCIKCYQETCLQCNSPNNCIVCKNNIIPTNGQCKQCNALGYYPIQDNCQSICGDGIKVYDDQCDDGNLLNFDGCNQFCHMEQDYFCTQVLNQLSNCYLSIRPSLTISLSNNDNDQFKYYVQQIVISTDQKVYNQNIKLIYQIENCYDTQMDYFQKNQQDQYNYLQFDINIKFKQSCQNITITFIVYGEIYNQYDQNLTKNSISITLDKIVVMNDEQIEITKSTQFVGSSIITSFAFLSVSSLMLGGTSQLVQFLNLIQQILYLQYVDIELPPNLYQFLDIFNSFNMNQLFSIFSISNLSTFENDNYFYSLPKQPRIQKNNHLEFIQQSNDIAQDLQDLRQLCLANGIIQNYYKLIEEMSSVQLHQSVIKIISQIAYETLNNAPEIVQFGLNILSNLSEQFWEQQDLQYIQQIASSLEQLFKLITKEEKYNTSNLKILFYKSIGTLTSIKLLMNIEFVPKIFETFFSIIQNNNIHVLEKSSWAAANLSAIKLLDPSFYNLFLSFISSSKEKIATNGLRGIGYYLQRAKEIPNIKEITICYQKLLCHKNPKICWNASSSLLNALSNPIMEQLLQEQQIINGLIHILKRRDNLKAQIHGIELVQKIQKEKFQIDVIKLFLQIIKDLEGEQNNFIEQKYQKKLREQIFDLLSSYLQNIDIKILIQQLEQDLHNDEVLSRLLEEIMKYLLDQKPDNAKILFGKGEQSKTEILQSEVSEDNEKIFQNFIGQNQLVQKYLKVDHDDHFHQCFQKVVKITQVIAEIIHESNIDNFVSFSIINTLDEFGSDPYFIKLYNNI